MKRPAPHRTVKRPVLHLGLIALALSLAGCAGASGRSESSYPTAILERLTAPEFEGRLSGSPGGEAAAAFLRMELDRLGAQLIETPAIEVSSARLVGAPALTVGGRALVHRVDFNEWTSLGRGGVAEGRLRILDRPGPLPDPGEGAWVLLVRSEAFPKLPAESIAEAAARGYRAVLLEQPERRIALKSVTGGQGPLPVLYLTEAAALSMAGKDGAPVRVELPLEVTRRPSHNVVAGLRRSSRPGAPTFLLTAHHDHVGDDSAECRYPGAFDNASGVAVVLEVARRYQAHPDPGFDLLVGLTTGEESGLLGAKALADRPPAPYQAVVNLDGVGSQPTLTAMRMGQTEPKSPFAALAATVLAAHGIEPRWRVGADDARAFMASGIPVAGLGEEPAAPIQIHTPSDRHHQLNRASLARVATILLEFLQRASALPWRDMEPPAPQQGLGRPPGDGHGPPGRPDQGPLTAAPSAPRAPP